MEQPDRPVSTLRIWLTAVRPFAYTASILSVALGAAMAHAAGYSIHWARLAVTLLGVVCFHTAANLLNDCFDHQRGLDRQVFPVSGAIVRGWITERQAFRAAMLCLVSGILCGFLLVAATGWVVLLLGILGAICAVGYTTPRFCFKYAGLGDAAIFLTFGVLPVFGTWWVQTQNFAWLPILWSIPLVSLTVGILHANNWRDIESDLRQGCRTVASLLGRDGSRRYYRVLVLAPFALVALYAGLGLVPTLNLPTPSAVLISFLALPLALRLTRITPRRDAQTFAMLDAQTAQLHLLFGVICSTAFWLSRHL
jgi:1,4-dihydroxy-2-naphthoate polyprenyltransferase